jgi:hypothetical protein
MTILAVSILLLMYSELWRNLALSLSFVTGTLPRVGLNNRLPKEPISHFGAELGWEESAVSMATLVIAASRAINLLGN